MDTPNRPTICAFITPQGKGAVGVVRISGDQTFNIISKIFVSGKGKRPADSFKPQRIYFGKIMDGDRILDEVLVSCFRGPASYTGEDVAEISCHGSTYIRQRLLQILLQEGAEAAKPGEFTLRAFLNGKLDLSQAEAVADIIDAESRMALDAGLQQMKGGYSALINQLREQLIKFAALLELELDFGEEDVAFASRGELMELIKDAKFKIENLLKSFEYGNVLKNGIPVVIAGKPNVGKSTLLNALLNDDRAIVSDIAGTTRDTIEEELVIEGIRFRFIDTAGIRQTDDVVEHIGVKRTFDKAASSRIIIYLFDPAESSPADLQIELNLLREQIDQSSIKSQYRLLLVANKIDLQNTEKIIQLYGEMGEMTCISAKQKLYLDNLKKLLINYSGIDEMSQFESVVTNARHAASLAKANHLLDEVVSGITEAQSGDLLVPAIREATHHLSEITGTVSTENLLDYIFSQFCIGK